MLDVDRYRPPFLSSTDAVIRLFCSMERRLPTSQERLTWTRRLDEHEATEADLVVDLLRGEGAVAADAPARIWIGLVGSAPEISDVAYWAHDLVRGLSLGQIADRIAADPSVAERLEVGDDHTFIVGIHRRILGRVPDPPELLRQMDDLATGRRTRAELAVEVVQTTEGTAHLRPASEPVLVTMGLLDRMPTDQELSDWASRIRAGAPLRDVVQEILGSVEMASR